MRHLCEHTSLTHLTTSMKYTCGLSTSAANGQDFTVYTTVDTDTDTSTPCTGVPATYIIRPGRSLGEAAYTQWVAHADH